MVNMPPSDWNSAQRMLLLKEKILYPSTQTVDVRGRMGTGQKPALAEQPYVYPPDYGKVAPGTTMGAVSRKPSEEFRAPHEVRGLSSAGAVSDSARILPTFAPGVPVKYQPHPTEVPSDTRRVTRIAGEDDAESAKRRLRGKPIPEGEAGHGTEEVTAGREGRQTMSFRPTGKREYKEGEQIREIDQRHFLSPKRALQGLKESGALGHKVKTGPEGSAEYQIADLPDDKGRDRSGRLVAAFRQQQKDLENLALQGKSLPESWGVHAGKDPRDLMRRLSGGKAHVYDSKGNAIPVGKTPIRGAGGRLDSSEKLRNFKRDPLGAMQGSSLNPANWGRALGLSEHGGTMGYRVKQAQQANLDKTLALLREVEQRKISNPNYIPSPAADQRIQGLYLDLVSQDTPHSRALARTMLQSPHAQKLIRDIEAQKGKESRQEGRERSQQKELSRQENPGGLRYNEIGAAARKSGIPFKVTPEKGRNQAQIRAQWEHMHDMLDSGVAMKDIQREYPEYFTMPYEEGRGERVAAEKERAKAEAEAEAARKKGDKEAAAKAKKKAAEAEKKAAKAEKKAKVGVKQTKIEADKELEELGVGHLPIYSRTGKPTSTSLREHLDKLGIPHKRSDKVSDLMDKLREPEAAPDPEAEQSAAPVETKQDVQERKEAERAKLNAIHAKQASDLEAGLKGHKTASTEEKDNIGDFLSDMSAQGLKVFKAGNFKFGKNNEHTMNKAGVKALANARKVYETKEMRNSTQSEALQEVLSGSGVYNSLSQKMKDNVKSGDISHWAPIYAWLTNGGDLNTVGVRGSEGFEDGVFRVSADDPMELAWSSLLKGL
jgi:hypothetical protein